MTKYFKVGKSNENYRELMKLWTRDLNGMFAETSTLLGFEANNNVVVNRNKLLVKPEALKKYRPEWLPKFKKAGSFLTPRASMKELITSFQELQQKYNTTLSLEHIWLDAGLRGEGEVVFDFDGSGWVFIMTESTYPELDSEFEEITENDFLKRKLAFVEQEKMEEEK